MSILGECMGIKSRDEEYFEKLVNESDFYPDLSLVDLTYNETFDIVSIFYYELVTAIINDEERIYPAFIKKIAEKAREKLYSNYFDTTYDYSLNTTESKKVDTYVRNHPETIDRKMTWFINEIN